MNKYPTWTRISATCYESEEQMDGTPDFVCEKIEGKWWVKWRSSAKSYGPYTDRKAAQDDMSERFGSPVGA
jgi:hypothetical protein